MRPAAHIQEVIQLLPLVFADNALPLDRLLRNYWRTRRYIGSNDRRQIIFLLETILRNYGFLRYHHKRLFKHATINTRWLVLISLVYLHHYNMTQLQDCFNGQQYHPTALDDTEKQICESLYTQPGPWPFDFEAVYNMPECWLPYWQRSFGHGWPQAALAFRRQPFIDIRVNTALITRQDFLYKLQNLPDGTHAQATPFSPDGVRLSAPIAAKNLPNDWQGQHEIQDESSQIVARLAVAQLPKTATILDYCAGGGGKSLAMAASGYQKIYAYDISMKRLAQTKQRAKIAGVKNIHILDTLPPAKKLPCDMVLVDSPCSGSGTWRRQLQQRWLFKETDLKNFPQKQLDILQQASSYVGISGCLVYITCSWFYEENEAVVTGFLQQNSSFALKDMRLIWQQAFSGAPPAGIATMARLSSHIFQTDSFFMAVMQRQL